MGGMAFSLIKRPALWAKERMIRTIKVIYKLTSLVALFAILGSCVKKDAKTFESELHKLQKEAYDFNFRFVEIRNKCQSHAKLFSPWSFDKLTESKHKNDSTLITKPFTLIKSDNSIVKSDIVSLNPKLDTFLYRVYESDDWVEQVYFGFQNSGILVYPEMDYLVGTNDCDFLFITKGISDSNFIEFHENGIWFTKPHHDPLGNAWVVSWRYILETQDNRKGWLGLDFDLQRIFGINSFAGNRYLLVHKSGLLLAAHPKALISLALPALYKSEYLKNINYKSEPEKKYTVHYSASAEVRKSFLEILNSNKKMIPVKVGNHNYVLLVANISELDAFLIRVVD